MSYSSKEDECEPAFGVQASLKRMAAITEYRGQNSFFCVIYFIAHCHNRRLLPLNYQTST